MDRKIAEQAAGLGNVALVGRRRVVAGKTNDVEIAELAGFDLPPGLPVAAVEAPLEAELERDAARFDLARDRDRVLEVVRQRLLAERRQAARDRGADQLGMGRGRGGDDDRVGGGEGLVDRGGRVCTNLRRDLGGSRRVGIGDDQAVDAGCRAEEPGVEPADATGADQGDLHTGAPSAASRPTVRRAWASTRRPIAAASEGGPQLLSCSTISQPR